MKSAHSLAGTTRWNGRGQWTFSPMKLFLRILSRSRRANDKRTCACVRGCYAPVFLRPSVARETSVRSVGAVRYARGHARRSCVQGGGEGIFRVPCLHADLPAPSDVCSEPTRSRRKEVR
ncbi:hypothetical protein AKJ09_00954 [Labilithrix luteola]|uniref:Uncharacterized protein n=1 Tax=Labilithrix luteola TaxID=1391654 RepID=A0A0K1PL94_9BACT|nr:hypothetical protein AKJ09_00954 [Labilithrix luteola]